MGKVYLAKIYTIALRTRVSYTDTIYPDLYPMHTAIKKDLSLLVHPDKAAFFPSFFKTGKGEYGEGDQFLGITVPEQRQVAKKYVSLATLQDLATLLESPYHEHRLTSLLILVYQYQKATSEQKKSMVEFYLSHTKRINNWDLVDTSASYILGDYLITTEIHGITPKLLLHLSQSENLWEKRISIISTHAYIKKGILAPTFEITELLMNDPHDLIHKACGWMLRETGKKDMEILIAFVEKHKTVMPRTILRYAIERMDREVKVRLMGRNKHHK